METARKLVLVADDYDEAARLLAEALGWAAQCDTMYARDGVEALQLADKRRPDAAILDIDMPRLGGIEAARLLRERFVDQRPLLIALTGKTCIADVQLSGMFDFVERKPIEMTELVKLLQTI
jgi:CheY-like chemotaxis protein